MRKLYILLLACLITGASQGQSSQSSKSHMVTHKLGGMMMYNTLQDPEYAHSNKLKNIMVVGDLATVRALTAKYQGTYKYASGNISSVAIPYKNLMAFSASTGVDMIEANERFGGGHSFMDTARIQNNIDSALLGAAPLTQPYKGNGVLVGIIDGGIYFRHQDFRHANGSTRIRYIWDQNDTTGPRFGIGSEWDSSMINNGTCTHKEPSSDQGHGTNVAGIACGNGLSWTTGYLAGRYTGTAPESNIVIVAVNNNTQDYLATIADAVNYIFTKADQLGMPCVINTSVGTYYGPHDGSEPSVKVIDNMLDAKKGRVLVAAAGNGGAIKHHLSYQLSPTDSLWTWFTYNNTTHDVYFDFWADTAQFRNGNFAFGCDNNAGVYQNRTQYFNALTDFHPAPGATVQIGPDTLRNGATILGIYNVAVTAYQGLYHVEFQCTPTLTTYLWRLQMLGQGTFDLWASKSLIGTSSIATAYPAGFSSPNYRYGDSLKTIVSGWQCSDKVITVANYYNRAGYFDKDSNYINLTIAPYNSVVGALANSSSHGPTRDGRMKPDISATGDVTTCTGDSFNIALLMSSGNSFKVSLGAKHNRNGGTSMSSPIVAGISALYLQEHPNANYNEVKTVIERTAKKDTFTSTNNIPNIRFGWGKINGFEALKYHVVYGCQDTGSINYVANANIDTGGCIAKVYGCTDTGSINYSAAANVNSGPCIPKKYGVTDTACQNYDSTANVNSGKCIGVGIKDVPNSDLSLDVVPNPFSKTTTVYIHTLSPLPASEIRFYDALGKVVDAIKLSAGTKELTYNNSKLAAGVYDLAIVTNGSIMAIKKVVVQ